MSAFDEGRLGVWHTSIASFKPTDGVTVDGYRALGVTDVFMDPYEKNANTGDYMLTPAMMQQIRNFNFKPQVYIDGTHTTNGGDTAQRALAAIVRLSPGVVQANIESGDDGTLNQTCWDFIRVFRAARPTFIYAINVAPRKLYAIPTALASIASDNNAYLRIQLGLGNNEGWSEPREELSAALRAGVPFSRVSFTYPVKDFHGDLALPNQYRGKPDRRISSGDLFDANLLREFGLA